MLIDYSERITIEDINIFFSLSNFENTNNVVRMNQTHSNKSIFIDQFLNEYID